MVRENVYIHRDGRGETNFKELLRLIGQAILTVKFLLICEKFCICSLSLSLPFIPSLSLSVMPRVCETRGVCWNRSVWRTPVSLLRTTLIPDSGMCGKSTYVLEQMKHIFGERSEVVQQIFRITCRRLLYPSHYNPVLRRLGRLS